MKVLLLKDLKGTGRSGEIKEVSDGYAKNFLIPKGFAKAATASTLKEAEMKKKYEKEEIERLEKSLQTLKSDLKKAPLQLSVRVGEHNEIFGGIHASEIEKALESRGYKDVSIEIDRPLKLIGEHKAKVKLGKGISGEIDIIVNPQK